MPASHKRAQKWVAFQTATTSGWQTKLEPAITASRARAAQVGLCCGYLLRLANGRFTSVRKARSRARIRSSICSTLAHHHANLAGAARRCCRN